MPRTGQFSQPAATGNCLPPSAGKLEFQARPAAEGLWTGDEFSAEGGGAWRSPSLEAAAGPGPGQPSSYCRADAGNRRRPPPGTAARGRNSCPSCSRRTTDFRRPKQDAGNLAAAVANRSAGIAPACLDIDFEDLVREVSAGRMVLDATARDGAISSLGPVAGDRQRFARPRRLGGQRQRLAPAAAGWPGGKVPIAIGLQQQGAAAKAVGKDDRNRPRGIANDVPVGHDEAMGFDRRPPMRPCPAMRRSGSAAITRTTAGWGVCAAGATDDGQAMATAGQSAIRTARRFFTRAQTYREAGQRAVIPALRRLATSAYSNQAAGGKCGDRGKAGKASAVGGSRPS